MSKEVVLRLNREINTILDRSDLQEQFEQRSFVIETSTPEALGAFMRSQGEGWGRALRDANIMPE